MAFASHQIHELYEANLAHECDSALPADWRERLADDEISAQYALAERDAKARTRQQVGADAWRRYRDERSQLGPPIGSGGTVVTPNGTVIHTIAPLERGASSVVRRNKTTGRFQTTER